MEPGGQSRAAVANHLRARLFVVSKAKNPLTIPAHMRDEMAADMMIEELFT
jgi:hypothetical protein